MMHIGILVVLVSCVVIVAAASALLWSRSYDEGALGHLGLAVLIFSSIITLSGIWWGGIEYEFLPESVLGRAGGAIFLASLTFRHFRLLHRERRSQPRVEACQVKPAQAGR